MEYCGIVWNLFWAHFAWVALCVVAGIGWGRVWALSDDLRRERMRRNVAEENARLADELANRRRRAAGPLVESSGRMLAWLNGERGRGRWHQVLGDFTRAVRGAEGVPW